MDRVASAAFYFKLRKPIHASQTLYRISHVLNHRSLHLIGDRKPVRASRDRQRCFAVKAGDAKYWTFQVGSGGANVVGRFRAEGGSGNDIKCLILDADSFENWRNGHRVKTYYNSEKITVANISVNLPEGEYVLVFDNTFSGLSNKAVTANVEMRW